MHKFYKNDYLARSFGTNTKTDIKDIKRWAEIFFYKETLSGLKELFDKIAKKNQTHEFNQNI